MDFKTNPDIFSLGSTNLVSDSFGLGDGAISTKQSKVHELKIIQCRSKTGCRPNNLDDQILDRLHLSIQFFTQSVGGFCPIIFSNSGFCTSEKLSFLQYFLRLSPLNKLMFCSHKLYILGNPPPIPIGKLGGNR
jgi:hypothetical protein